jgi:hypothetical protein
MKVQALKKSTFQMEFLKVTGESRLPGQSTTGESRLPGVFTTGESFYGFELLEGLVMALKGTIIKKELSMGDKIYPLARGPWLIS